MYNVHPDKKSTMVGILDLAIGLGENQILKMKNWDTYQINSNTERQQITK